MNLLIDTNIMQQNSAVKFVYFSKHSTSTFLRFAHKNWSQLQKERNGQTESFEAKRLQSCNSYVKPYWALFAESYTKETSIGQPMQKIHSPQEVTIYAAQKSINS